jgi:hypothetical protein
MAGTTGVVTLPQDVRANAQRSRTGSDSDMSIDRSGPTSSLIAALRADITRRSERNRSASTGDGQHRDTAVLRRALTDLVQSTPADDPQTREALQRRVIETVLRWEFGADPDIAGNAQPMIEQIARTLQADPRHGEQFARLVQELQQP